MSNTSAHISQLKELLGPLGLAAAFTAGLAFVGGNSTTANANPGHTECYKIKSADTPMAGDEAAEAHEIWCYKELHEPVGARLVYNIDDEGRMTPELSLMIEADGTLRHASRQTGKLTFHRVQLDAESGFNPIGAPLSPPPGAERVSEPITPMATESFDRGLELFQEYGDIPIIPAKVTEGTVSANVPAELIPWRGYWYPYSSAKMHRGDQSVTAKYDKFVARRAANTNPGAQKWEKWWHSYHGMAWSGHCNGWAAASVMTKEPTKPVTDPYSGVTFSIADLKGLLIEQNYCPKMVFYGSRYMERPGDNPRDILAGTFHNVLTYFIGELKKPVLMDYMPSRPVENTAVSGYTMNIKKRGPNSYLVEAKVKVHNYDKEMTDEVGIAPFKERVFKYTLRTNAEGKVVSGSWISRNPDFIWIPLAPASCKYKNKVFEQMWIDEIFRFQK